jgi:hypothetical protein
VKGWARSFQIYQDEVYDLLFLWTPLCDMCVISKSRFEIRGLTKVQVSSSEEILRYFAVSMKRRCTESTAKNATSSRSHLVFKIDICGERSGDPNSYGHLYFIDLAALLQIPRLYVHLWILYQLRTMSKKHQNKRRKDEVLACAPPRTISRIDYGDYLVRNVGFNPEIASSFERCGGAKELVDLLQSGKTKEMKRSMRKASSALSVESSRSWGRIELLKKCNRWSRLLRI